MITNIMEWVSITALLLVVSGRPFVSYQLPVDFGVLGGALAGVLAPAETLMAYTINTGTMLIEEGVLMPESLRFESEPRTPFYMAGEVIRESRKASGEQSKYGSEGNTAHSHEAIDHYDHPRDIGSLPTDDPHRGIGLLSAPECGDVMKLQMKINSETQVVEEAEFKTFGCGSAIASSSLATECVKGKASRKRLPSRTRISSASSAFPRATLLDAARYSRIRRRLHLVSSPIF
jgi:hypothetical protein